MKIFWTQQAFIRLTNLASDLGMNSQAKLKRFYEFLFDSLSESLEESLPGIVLPELNIQNFREIRVMNIRIIVLISSEQAEIVSIFKTFKN